MSGSATHEAIEAVARNAYGRLVAYLAARSGDVAGAEDALGDAFAAALRRWPVDGVPQKLAIMADEELGQVLRYRDPKQLDDSPLGIQTEMVYGEVHILDPDNMDEVMKRAYGIK